MLPYFSNRQTAKTATITNINNTANLRDWRYWRFGGNDTRVSQGLYLYQ